jgi:hypothetical protein
MCRLPFMSIGIVHSTHFAHFSLLTAGSGEQVNLFSILDFNDSAFHEGHILHVGLNPYLYQYLVSCIFHVIEFIKYLHQNPLVTALN